MQNRFFEQPILNSPYEYPTQYWELDDDGQPTYRILDGRRNAEFITPIPEAQAHQGNGAPGPPRIQATAAVYPMRISSTTSPPPLTRFADASITGGAFLAPITGA